MKILIVEDEVYHAKPMANVLMKHNYSVEIAYDGEEGLYFGLNGSYDLILLDIMLPIMDGIEVLKKLRAAGIKIPVMMLTARDQVEDRIAGLDFGADDYLPKPFVYEELLARMRALLRRGLNLQENARLKMGSLELDVHGFTVFSKDKSRVLPKKEAQLLELLLSRSKKATPKELILDKLWDFDSEAAANNVDYHIWSLRKKLKTIGAGVGVKTIRNVGYLIEEETVDER